MSQKKIPAIVGKESFCRMNFLYQASVLLAGQNNTLSSYYGQLCRNIGKKAVLRCHPDLKRNICKRCCLAQEPGVTAELDIEAQPPTIGKRRRKRRKKKHTEIDNIDENAKVTLKCLQCEYQRTFRINSNYSFWLENPDSIAEICTLDRQDNNPQLTSSNEIK